MLIFVPEKLRSSFNATKRLNTWVDQAPTDDVPSSVMDRLYDQCYLEVESLVEQLDDVEYDFIADFQFTSDSLIVNLNTPTGTQEVTITVDLL